MSDLISKNQSLIEWKEDFKSYVECLDIPRDDYKGIMAYIDEVPSAEPERKTAEWIYGENGGQDGWYCSKCGLFIPWDYEYYGLDNIDFIADFHTCPKCDRKMLKYTGMRGEQE